MDKENLHHSFHYWHCAKKLLRSLEGGAFKVIAYTGDVAIAFVGQLGIKLYRKLDWKLNTVDMAMVVGLKWGMSPKIQVYTR